MNPPASRLRWPPLPEGVVAAPPKPPKTPKPPKAQKPEVKA